jgi:UDP-glucose 4-epimerase
VLDLASAHTAALQYLAQGGTNNVFNVGAGRGYSNLDIIDALKRISGVDFPVEHHPRRPGDPAQLIADVEKIDRQLGWRAQHSDLDTIVQSAWRWQSSHPDGYDS